MVLGLVGGIFILLNALVWFVLGDLIGSLAGFIPGVPGLPVDAAALQGFLMMYGAIGLIFAILVIAGSVMLYVKPAQHLIWGIVVLLFSLFSIVIGGGFILGLILGLIGGILGLVWKPPMPAMAPPGMAPPPMPPQ